MRLIGEQIAKALASPDPRAAVHALGLDLPPRPGAVVTVGSTAVQGLGAVLANLTGRPHRHRPRLRPAPDSTFEETTLVIGLAEDLRASGGWIGFRGDEVGVVTARTPKALRDFAGRAVLCPPLGDESVVHVGPPRADVHPLPDVITVQELRQSTARRPRQLLVRSHGRECAVMMPDGVICGRATRDGPVQLGDRTPPCVFGRGCFRQDIDDDSRFLASDLSADVVVIDSCHALGLGASVVPDATSLALSATEGTTLAVVGAIGTQIDGGAAIDALSADLRAGSTLGAALRRLNAPARSGRSINRYGLYGDPGRTL